MTTSTNRKLLRVRENEERGMTTKTLAVKKHRLFINAMEGGDTMVWLGLAGTSDWVLLSNGADRADAVAVAVEQLERLAKRLAKELA